MAGLFSKRNRTRTTLMASALGATFLLSACGSSTTDAADATNTGDCTPSQGVTADAVKVGIIFPQSGPAAATFSEFDRAAQLRFKEENDKGGVNGRQIIATVYDDKSDGSTQVTVANKALLSDKVFGIVAASQADTMYPELNRQNVPTTGLSSLPPYGTDLNTFGFNGSFPGKYQSSAPAERFKAADTTDIAVISHSSPGARSSASGFLTTAPSAGLTEAVSINDMPVGTFDATAMALKIKQSGATGIYSISLIESGISLLSALKQQGVTIDTFMMALLSSPEYVASSNGLLEGVVGAPSGFKPLMLQDESVQAYVSAMEAAGYDPYVAFAPIGYMSADLMIRGLQEAGTCVTKENFVNNLRQVTDYSGAGLGVAPVSFQPGVNPTGDPSKCTWFVTVQDNTLVPDAAATCGELIAAS